MSTRFTELLADRSRYHHQLDRLAARARGRRLDALVQDGVRFTQLSQERDEVLALVSRAVVDGSYRPGPATLRRARIGGKEREMARIAPLDLVVHGVIAEALAEVLEPSLSPRLYSYRRGRSPWQALRALARLARAHRAERPDPRTRGLYVLRSDVLAYTDSIPLVDGARLWLDLAAATGLASESSCFAMLRALLRPDVQDAAGAHVPIPRDRGLLFGAPTTNVLGNLYLTPLDEALSGLDGHYARFGDDVLFAHVDPGRVQNAKTILETMLAERGLTPNSKKLRVLYWNGAARPSLAWPQAEPTSVVAFLGASVGFDGTIALAPAKWTTLLRELRARVRRTAHLMLDEGAETRARVLAGIVEEAFDVRSELAVDQAPMLADLVSDRHQLRQLDYLLARWIAEEATGRAGPRAFRELGYRWLRQSAGLGSRVVARNRGRS